MIFYNAPAGDTTKSIDSIGRVGTLGTALAEYGYQEEFSIADGAAQTTYGEMGLHSDPLNAYGSSRMAEYHRDLEAAMRELGVDFPHRYNIRDLIIHPERFPDHPVFVKTICWDRGEGKALVYSRKELINYLLWREYARDMTEYESPNDPRLHEYIEDKRASLIQAITDWDGTSIGKVLWYDEHADDLYRDGVRRGGLTAEQAYQVYMITDYTRFEQYIQGPVEGLNTSLRIVVDATGTVHYAQLHASEIIEGVNNEQWSRRVFTSQEITAERLKRLHHPDSPTFVPMRTSLSNRAQGAVALVFQSAYLPKEVLDQSRAQGRELLSAHGIDSSSGRLPDGLLDLSQNIAHRMRFMFPFVGIDYLYDVKSHTWKFIEANAGPDLNVAALGSLPDGITDPNDLHRMLISEITRRVMTRS